MDVIYKKGKAVFVAYDTGGNCRRDFFIEDIIHSEQIPQKHTPNYNSTVLFKLKNRLAKSYFVKPGETVLEFTNNYIVVSSKAEDKELLIRRLLRYYDQCEILYPKSLRDRVIELVTQMEQMYV